MSSAINIFQAGAPAGAKPLDISAYSKSFNKQITTDWSIPEAFLCLLFSAAFADGVVADVEKEEIFALTHRSRALKSLTPGQLAEINAAINQRLATRPNGLEEACGSLPTEMRLPVFAHCVDIVLADGELVQTEADFLNRVVAGMGLDPAEAQKVMDVMVTKNRV